MILYYIISYYIIFCYIISYYIIYSPLFRIMPMPILLDSNVPITYILYRYFLQSFHTESTHFSAGHRWFLRIITALRKGPSKTTSAMAALASWRCDFASGCEAAGWMTFVNGRFIFKTRGFLSLSLTESHWISQWNSMEFHGIPQYQARRWIILPHLLHDLSCLVQGSQHVSTSW